MEKRVLNYETLGERVGAVTIGWTNLESHLKAFLYDLIVFNSAAFEEDDAFHVLTVLLSNMEMRHTIANAKALAHEVRDPVDSYDRTEKLLNWIDNDLRNERNRYTHDVWRIWGPIIHRIKSGAVVRRKPASGERALLHHTSKQYLGTLELQQFADQITYAIKQVQQLGDELRKKLNEIRPLPA